MKIIKPSIFPENILSGVITRNIELFNEYGYSISTTPTISQDYVNECKLKQSEFLNIPFDCIIKQNQIHSDNIVFVENENQIEDADAMICAKQNICLNISIADCISCLIYDSENKIIASAHSGWKGTQLEIIPKTIKLMSEKFNSKSNKLLVYLSPSASVENYEVGEEFLDFFHKFTIKRENKYYFDNKKAVIHQLLNMGIKDNNIETSNLDTISNLELHSYRRDKEKSGRMSAFIMMK